MTRELPETEGADAHRRPLDRRARRRAGARAPTTTCPSRSGSPSSSPGCARSAAAAARRCRRCCTAHDVELDPGAPASPRGQASRWSWRPRSSRCWRRCSPRAGRSCPPRRSRESRVGRAARPAVQHRAHDGDDAAAQARRPAADRDGARQRLPAVSRFGLRAGSPRSTAGCSVVTAALLLGVSYWLVGRHLERTLTDAEAQAAQSAARAPVPDRARRRRARVGRAGLAVRAAAAAAPRWRARSRRRSASWPTRATSCAPADRDPDGSRRRPRQPRRRDRRAARDGGRRARGGRPHGRAARRADGARARAAPGGRRASASTSRPRARAASRRRRGPSGVALRWHLAPARVRGDTRLLERLAGNLIDNGVRYNRAGGYVDVRTGEEGGRAMLRVSNTGPRAGPRRRWTGCSSRSSAAAARTTAVAPGSGLSIVQAIAEAHGGRVALMARPGGGLDVEIALPAAETSCVAGRERGSRRPSPGRALVGGATGRRPSRAGVHVRDALQRRREEREVPRRSSARPPGRGARSGAHRRESQARLPQGSLKGVRGGGGTRAATGRAGAEQQRARRPRTRR